MSLADARDAVIVTIGMYFILTAAEAKARLVVERRRRRKAIENFDASEVANDD